MLVPEFGRLGLGSFAEMRRMQNEINRLFSGLGMAETQEFPPVNLWAGENSVVVTAEMPGLTTEDVDLTVRQDMLTIQGRHEPKIEGDKDKIAWDKVAWHRRERGFGTFARTVKLPFRVDTDKVQARFLNGILEIELQRPEADRPRRIDIRAS